MSVGDGEQYVILGRPESGYSMKVRSAMRFKGVAHEWQDRCRRNEQLFQSNAKVQLIPLVFRPDGTATQDSTPILEELEERHPEPSWHPSDPVLRFLSDLIEEYGDEWANKLMFHHRWGYGPDRRHRSGTLARGMLEGSPLRLFAPLVAPFIVRRMVPRMSFAGANENNAPLLVESWANLVAMLDVHLAHRPYLFGARPAFGDFGLWGQLHQASVDPTCGDHLRRHGPAVLAWIERMLDPKVEGDFEPFERLEPTLRPIFEREVGPRFLAWDAANALAREAGEERTELEMDGRLYYQRTFKYPAVGLQRLRRKLEAVSENATLCGFLDETGCLAYLSRQSASNVAPDHQIKGAPRSMASQPIPVNNRLVDCQALHAEVLDLEAGTVWQSHGPIDREAYAALELPSGMVKVGIGAGVMDEHYFRRSPGAEVDGPVAAREIGGHLFIHCADPPKGGPEKPFGDDPKRMRVDKHHSLVFEAGREVQVIRDDEGRDFVQVVAASPEGGGLLQTAATPPAETERPLPDGWSMRTERLASRTTIHLPSPTEAWFFANGASFQGPVDDFGASGA